MECQKVRSWFYSVTIVAVFLTLACIFACSTMGQKSSGTMSPTALEKSGAPGWLSHGCEPYLKSLNTPKPCGVGYASNAGSPLARDTASSRARAELSKSLQVKVASVLSDEQNTSGNAGVSQTVTESITQFTKSVLAGSKVTDSWTDEDGTFYVLVVVEPAVYRSILSSVLNMPENIRNALQKDY